MSYAPPMQRPSTASQSSSVAAEQWQQAHYMGGGADSGINTAAPGSLTGQDGGGPEEYDYVAGSGTGYTQQQVDGEWRVHAVCLIRDALKCVVEVSLKFFAHSSSLVPYCVS